MNRQQLISALQKRYPSGTFRTTEEFDGTEGGVWTSGESGLEDKKGLPVFNYYAQDNSETTYIFGVRKTLHNWLEKQGWYCEWYDAGTLMIWEL
jgi:hypothetical protein